MRILITALFSFLCLPILPNNIKVYLSLVDRGENLAYNFQFDSTEVIIDKAIDLDPSRPEAYLLKSKLHLWFFLGSNDPQEFEYFMQYSDSVIIKVDRILEKEDENSAILYFLGNIYKYRAMAYGSNGNTLDAFWSTKKAVSYFENVIELDSNFYAAYGGIGIFEYALSYVPALFNWALALSGLSADQSNGFKYIKLAAENASVDKVEYNFHLSKLYDEHLAEYRKSLSVLKKLIKKYPNNQLFHYQAAIEYMKIKELDKAIDEINIVKEIDNQKFVQTLSYSNFLLGDIYFWKNEFNIALLYYKEFLTTTTTIDYTGIASLRAAICNYFLNNEEEYKRYLFLASNGNMDIEEDNQARVISLRLLEEGIEYAEVNLIKIENDYYAGNYLNAEQIIENTIDSLINDDVSATIAHIKSSILISQGKYDLAKKEIPDIDSLELDFAGWVVPLTYFNLAEISYNENDTEKVLEYLDIAENNNDYQKQNLIQSLINGLRYRIKQN